MKEQGTGHRVFVIAASIVVVLFGLHQAQEVVSLMLISIFIALVATPPVLWLERKRIPSGIAVVLVVLAMIGIFVLVGTIVGASLSSFSDAMPFYQQRLRQELLALRPFLAGYHITVTDAMLLDYLDPGPVLGLVMGALSAVGSAFSTVLMVLLTVVFILLEASSFPVKLRSVMGDPERAFPRFAALIHDVKRYVVIKTVINLAAGTLIAFWMVVLGVDFPVLWGFLTFILLFIPNIGSVIAAVPAVLLALTQHGGGTAALTALGYFAVGTLLGNILEPRIMGQRLGLSTLVVFLSLIFWGTLLGPAGVVLCIPLTMTMKVLFEYEPKTEWIGLLLGPAILPSVQKTHTKVRSARAMRDDTVMPTKD